jgi:hypothetical protein
VCPKNLADCCLSSNEPSAPNGDGLLVCAIYIFVTLGRAELVRQSRQLSAEGELRYSQLLNTKINSISTKIERLEKKAIAKRREPPIPPLRVGLQARLRHHQPTECFCQVGDYLVEGLIDSPQTFSQ